VPPLFYRKILVANGGKILSKKYMQITLRATENK
jgi:hypothetical protein